MPDVSSRAPSLPICRSCSQPSSSLSSIFRRPGRLTWKFRRRCSPAPIAIEEHSHAAMANAYEAGAAGLPFALFRGYRGVDLPKVNPNIKQITCPFTGEQLAAVPAIRPDVAVVHALRADRTGNVLI